MGSFKVALRPEVTSKKPVISVFIKGYGVWIKEDKTMKTVILPRIINRRSILLSIEVDKLKGILIF